MFSGQFSDKKLDAAMGRLFTKAKGDWSLVVKAMDLVAKETNNPEYTPEKLVTEKIQFLLDNK